MDAPVDAGLTAFSPLLPGSIEALRVVVQAMGAYSNGKNVVLKLQSAHTTHADILQAAFPDTPVVFVFRDPVEVAASNLVGVCCLVCVCVCVCVCVAVCVAV